MTEVSKTDWQVYTVICDTHGATPRGVVSDVHIPISEAVSSIRRLYDLGLVRNGDIEDGRAVLCPVDWRELFDKDQILELFGIEIDDLNSAYV